MKLVLQPPVWTSRARLALTAYKRFLALGSDQDAATVEKVRQHVSALETASQLEPAPVT